MHVTDVEKKVKDGYRLVKFSEVGNEGAIKGKVIRVLVENNYYGDLELDGGQLRSKKLCNGDSCKRKTITFAFRSADHNLRRYNYKHQYFLMKRKY